MPRKQRLARFTYVTDLIRRFVSKATVPENVVTAKREGRHCLYLTGNGVRITQHWPLFTGGLLQRGHNDDVIRKVIGGNVMRVAREFYGA